MSTVALQVVYLACLGSFALADVLGAAAKDACWLEANHIGMMQTRSHALSRGNVKATGLETKSNGTGLGNVAKIPHNIEPDIDRAAQIFQVHQDTQTHTQTHTQVREKSSRSIPPAFYLSSCLVLCLVTIAVLVFTAPSPQESKGAVIESPPETKGPVREDHSKFRKDIQGLRAYAVMSVFMAHLGEHIHDTAGASNFWPGGNMGVDVFFVISGWVVTPQLLRLRGSSNDWFVSFFARRVKRLLPILIVVVLATGVALPFAWRSGEAETISKFLKIGIAALLGNGNNWMIHTVLLPHSTSSGPRNPFFHLWSLGCEEQFYLLWALMLWPALHLNRFLGLGELEADGKSVDAMPAALGLLVPAIVGSMLLCCYGDFSNDPIAKASNFYSVFHRFWQLGSGAALVMCSKTVEGIMSYHKAIPRILDVLVLILLPLSQAQQTRFSTPWPWGLVATAGTLCYLAAGLGQPRFNLNARLSCSVPVYIGDISYSIYLWHVPIMALMTCITGSEHVSVPLTLLLVMSISIAISIAGYHLVEQPFRKVSQAPWRIICVGLLSIVSAALVLTILAQSLQEGPHSSTSP